MENNRFIKLPVSIFNSTNEKSKAKTFSKEFLVLVYLYMLAQINKTDSVKVRLQTIANRCGLGNKTNIVRLISNLIERGYITKEQEINYFTG